MEAVRQASLLPHVLVVERRAHEAGGHYPVLVAELAGGFAALGCPVTVLTAHGWYLEGELAAGLSVARYGILAAGLDGFAERLRRNRLRRGRWWLRRAGEVLRVIVLTRAAGTKARRLGGETVVVVLSDVDAPALIAALAGGGRWLVYVFRVPHRPTTRFGLLVERLVTHFATTAERSRRRHGGCCVVAAQSDVVRGAWATGTTGTGLELVVSFLAGSGEPRSIPDARQQLGIERSLKLALLFGTIYDEKDPATVFEAFSELDDWQLVVGGTLAAAIPPTAPVFRRYPGFVDERTRDLLYSAADLVIVSFLPGFYRNSGTLRDAITWGVPVVCSDRSQPADITRQYKLGTVFQSGDPASLAHAVRAAPTEIDPTELARARAERSNRAAAEHALDAVGVRPHAPSTAQ